MNEKYIFLIYCAYILFVSIITFFTYGKDKSLAKKSSSSRVKEKYLLGLATFGGALGAFFGRIIFHHKTDKSYFSITIYLSLLLNILALLGLAYIALF